MCDRPTRARIATATVTIGGKKHVITLPLDAEPDLPEAEIKARAIEAWHELEAAERSLNAKEVARVQSVLANGGLFDHFARDASEAIGKFVHLTVAGEIVPDNPSDRDAWGEAATQHFRSICATILHEHAADEAFRAAFARSVVRHAVAWTTAELNASTPRDQLLAMDEEAFHEAFMARYRDEGFLPVAVDHLLDAYFAQITRDIIETLEQDPDLDKKLAAAVQETLESLRPPRFTEAMPNIVEEGHVQINATQVAFTLLKAIHDAGTRKGWDDFDGQRPPTYSAQTGKKSKDPGQIFVTVRGKQEDIAPNTATLDNLWASLDKLDDLASDVLLVCLSSCTKTDGAAWVNVDALLDARGVKRIQKKDEPGNWQHGHRQEDRVAVGRALEQLDSLWIEVQNLELTPAGKRRKARRFTHESRALAVVDRVFQSDLEGGKVVRAARVVLGSWVNAYKDAEITQLGFLAQKALTYDPYRNQPEKRLAKYLAFHYRYNTSRPAIRRKVCDLLETANIPADGTRPNRASGRLDKALDRLREDDVIGTWRPILEPGERPARGWFGPWLESMIEIEPPEFIRGKYAKIRA